MSIAPAEPSILDQARQSIRLPECWLSEKRDSVIISSIPAKVSMAAGRIFTRMAVAPVRELSVWNQPYRNRNSCTGRTVTVILSIKDIDESIIERKLTPEEQVDYDVAMQNNEPFVLRAVEPLTLPMPANTFLIVLAGGKKAPFVPVQGYLVRMLPAGMIVPAPVYNVHKTGSLCFASTWYTTHFAKDSDMIPQTVRNLNTTLWNDDIYGPGVDGWWVWNKRSRKHAPHHSPTELDRLGERNAWNFDNTPGHPAYLGWLLLEHYGFVPKFESH